MLRKSAIEEMPFITEERRDFFQFIRYGMYLACMFSFQLERRLPNYLSSVGILLELLLEVFLYFVTLHILILYVCTVYVNYQKADLELFLNSLMQTIIYWWAITMKIYFRRLRKTNLENLINFINLNYKTRSAEGLTYVTMDRCFVMSNKFIKFFVYCCFIGCIFWLFLPFAYGDRSLPLNCWYPFDYKKPKIYEFVYFLQCVGQIQVAFAFACSSGCFMVLGIMMCGQYDILLCSLKNIFATIALNSNATESEMRKLYKLQEFAESESNEFYCSKEITCEIDSLIRSKKQVKGEHFHLQFRKVLKQCVDHHNFIKKCLNEIENIYSPIWFLKFGEATFVACSVAFLSVKSTTADTTFIKILSLSQYFILIFWELLIICYVGEIVHMNSQRCSEAILRSPWYLYIREIKFDLLLFLSNSKTPFRLTAGKMFTLNAEMYKSLITTFFSFFTLLQKMDYRQTTHEAQAISNP